MLTRKNIKSFQKLHKRCFGKDINHKEAYEKSIQLVRLLQLVYQPITESEYKEVVKRRQETTNRHDGQ